MKLSSVFALITRIENIAQGISQKVGAQHREHDRPTWENIQTQTRYL